MEVNNPKTLNDAPSHKDLLFVFYKMSSDLQRVAQLLQATLDPRQHKQGKCSAGSSPAFASHRMLTIALAELALKDEEKKPGFSLLLLSIVASESLPLNTRLSGALFFKNFVKFNWVVGQQPRLPMHFLTGT